MRGESEGVWGYESEGGVRECEGEGVWGCESEEGGVRECGGVRVRDCGGVRVRGESEGVRVRE